LPNYSPNPEVPVLRIRRLLLAALVSSAAFVGFGLSVATPAGAFCDTSEGCSPCGGGLIIDGKNTRIEFHQC